MPDDGLGEVLRCHAGQREQPRCGGCTPCLLLPAVRAWAADREAPLWAALARIADASDLLLSNYEALLNIHSRVRMDTPEDIALHDRTMRTFGRELERSRDALAPAGEGEVHHARTRVSYGGTKVTPEQEAEGLRRYRNALATRPDRLRDELAEALVGVTIDSVYAIGVQAADVLVDALLPVVHAHIAAAREQGQAEARQEQAAAIVTALESDPYEDSEWTFRRIRDALIYPAGALAKVKADGSEACHRCGRDNPSWAAPSPLWNMVMRGNDINGAALFDDLVCVPCFATLAAEAGLTGHWRLALAPEPMGLINETPSGRVWDPERWLWVDRAALADPQATLAKVRADELRKAARTARHDARERPHDAWDALAVSKWLDLRADALDPEASDD